jgi:hypothetical protein
VLQLAAQDISQLTDIERPPLTGGGRSAAPPALSV